MRTTCKVLLAVLLLSSSAGVASAATSVSAGIHVGPSGRATVDLGFFYDDLAPYGNWIERPSYGWVWTPRAVAASWRPYQDGHWVWTDEGWLWVTDEAFGWATYHYGRWYDDPDVGWAWVPDDDWGPAWVSWQEGADYVGWAPLPPRVSVSVSYSRGYAYGIHPEAYVFVPERHFLSPRLAAYVVARPRIEPIYRETRNCTSYQFRGGRAFNRGVPLDRIERFGRRAQRYQVADLEPAYRNRGPRFQGDRVTVFRPQVQRAARLAPPISRPAARNSVVTAERFRANNPRRAAAIERRQTTRQQTTVREQTVVRETRVRETGRQRQARIDRAPRQVERRIDNRAAANARREQAATRQARAARTAKVEHERAAGVERQRAVRVERERSVRHERQRSVVERQERQRTVVQRQERQRAVKAQREQSVQRRQARQRTEAVRQREVRSRQAERVDRSQRRQRPERQVAPARQEPRPQRLHAQERQRRQPQMQRERPARQQQAARERARKENGRPNRQHGHGRGQ